MDNSLNTHWAQRRSVLKSSQDRGEVRVWTERGRLHVSCSRNEDFRKGAESLGGRYRPRSGGAWSFPLYSRPHVFALIDKVFGPTAVKVGFPTEM